MAIQYLYPYLYFLVTKLTVFSAANSLSSVFFFHSFSINPHIHNYFWCTADAWLCDWCSLWVLISRQPSLRRRQPATTSFTSRTSPRAATSTRHWSRFAWATRSSALICLSQCSQRLRVATRVSVCRWYYRLLCFLIDSLRSDIANRLSVYNNVRFDCEMAVPWTSWSYIVHDLR